LISLFRCAGNSSRRFSQTTEFADVFWTVFRGERRILKKFPVDSLLGDARSNPGAASHSPELLRRFASSQMTAGAPLVQSIQLLLGVASYGARDDKLEILHFP
jgi:hypothetical protein